MPSEQRRAYMRQWEREWREKNPGATATKLREWRALHPGVSAEQARIHRQNNPGYAAKKQRDFRARRAALIATIKDVPCVDCGDRFPPECMDFDHRGDKLFGIVGGARTEWAKILEEIAKCDIVCANCHRIRTKKQQIKRHQRESA